MEKQETRDFRTKNRVSLRVTAQHYFHRALRRAHFSDIPWSSSNATTQRIALSFLADKEFGRDRRSSRESKVRRGARGVSRKPETPERRWGKKRTARSGARCGMVWHGARTRDTRWRARKASLRCGARAPLVRFRLDSTRLGSARLGSAVALRAGAAPFGWRGTNEERARRRQPDSLPDFYAWWRERPAKASHSRLPAFVSWLMSQPASQPVRVVRSACAYCRRTNSRCKCRQQDRSLHRRRPTICEAI